MLVKGATLVYLVPAFNNITCCDNLVLLLGDAMLTSYRKSYLNITKQFREDIFERFSWIFFIVVKILLLSAKLKKGQQWFQVKTCCQRGDMSWSTPAITKLNDTYTHPQAPLSSYCIHIISAVLWRICRAWDSMQIDCQDNYIKRLAKYVINNC